jgi:NADPH:quinone reductase-like Zn-dependent oxidoreductase
MAPQTQTRVVVTSFDPANLLDTLAVETHAPVPAPAAGEILVRVTARPVNPADVFSIMGVYPGFTPASLPAVPGLEGVGVVADANGCATVKEGDRGVVFVDAKGGQGSWQEYVAVSAANFLPVPPSVSDETASQFLVNPVRALLSLLTLRPLFNY